MNMRNIIVAIAIVALAACSKEKASDVKDKAQDAAATAAQKVEDAIDIAVPFGERDDPAAREKERFDEQWRGLEVFRDVKPTAPQPAAPDVKVVFAPTGKENGFKNVRPEAIQNAPVVVPIKGDMSGPSVLKTQVYLDRLHFSVGALDGRWGRNSAIALWWYQRSRGINAAEPGALDEATFRSLAAAAGGEAAVTQRTV